MENEIIEKLEQIKDCIISKCENDVVDYGLMEGISGWVYFLAYYDFFAIKNKENNHSSALQKAVKIVENSKKYPHSYSSGLAGFAFLFKHLENKKLIEIPCTSFYSEIDKYIVAATQQQMKSNNFDFLHGPLGIIHYGIQNPRKLYPYKDAIINYMNEVAGIKNGNYHWLDNNFNDESKEKNIVNLGLAHGLPSAIIITSKLHLLFPNDAFFKNTLNGFVNYLYSKKIKNTKSISLYPSNLLNGISSIDSRLAWCYGDLGIGLAFWQAGKALNNNQWKNEALEIFHHACGRKDLKKNNVIDAGLCHGTAGISQIFRRMWWETKDQVFKETANYWIDQTLKMATFEDGLAGYKIWQNKAGWKNEYGMLEGIAGIGLALLSHISEDEPTWDNCLLLS